VGPYLLQWCKISNKFYVLLIKMFKLYYFIWLSVLLVEKFFCCPVTEQLQFTLQNTDALEECMLQNTALQIDVSKDICMINSLTILG